MKTNLTKTTEKKSTANRKYIVKMLAKIHTQIEKTSTFELAYENLQDLRKMWERKLEEAA